MRAIQDWRWAEQGSARIRQSFIVRVAEDQLDVELAKRMERGGGDWLPRPTIVDVPDEAPDDEWPPVCQGCARPLRRVDRRQVDHLILDNNQYRDVNVYDGPAAGDGPGVASETDLRCGYCGTKLTPGRAKFFYQRWALLLSATEGEGL